MRDVRYSMFRQVSSAHSIEISDLSMAEMIDTVFNKKSVDLHLEMFENYNSSPCSLNHVLSTGMTANFYLQCVDSRRAYATFTSRDYIGLYNSATHSVDYIKYEGNLPIYGLTDNMMYADEINSNIAVSVPYYIYWDINTSRWLFGFDNQADYIEYMLKL